MPEIRRLINKDKTIYIQPLSLKIVPLHTVCRAGTMRFSAQCSTRVCKAFRSTASQTHAAVGHMSASLDIMRVSGYRTVMFEPTRLLSVTGPRLCVLCGSEPAG